MDLGSAKTLTIILLVAAGLLLAAYDVWVFVRFGGDATISRLLLRAAMDSPIVAFAFGVLIGHFFWAQKIEVEKKTEDVSEESEKI